MADVRAPFCNRQEFWSSPLYRQLSAVIAVDPFLVGLVVNARAGHGLTFAFFGAVQALLLSGIDPRWPTTNLRCGATAARVLVDTT